MGNTSLPGWLDRQRESLAVVKEAKQAQALASATIRADGEKFWAELREELMLIADNLPVGFEGRFHHGNFPTSRHEDHCQIQISYPCSTPRMSHTDLWFLLGDDKIRSRYSLKAGELSLLLCVEDGKILVLVPKGKCLLTAEAVAQYICEPMVEHAKIAALASS